MMLNTRLDELSRQGAETRTQLSKPGAYFSPRQRLAISSEARCCLGNNCPGCSELDDLCLTNNTDTFFTLFNQRQHAS